MCRREPGAFRAVSGGKPVGWIGGLGTDVGVGFIYRDGLASDAPESCSSFLHLKYEGVIFVHPHDSAGIRSSISLK